MKLLGLDIETTGFDFEKDAITEVGAVLWDTDEQSPELIFSAFVKTEKTPPLSQEIIEITGITQALLDAHGRDFPSVYSNLESLASHAHYIVAHNGETFDKPFLKAEAKKFNCEFLNLAWIDTQTDIEYPERIKTRKLSHLAAEHGFLNPFPHRAVFDVLTMLKVVSRYNIEEVVELSQQPVVWLQAVVSFNDKELAKARGYRWYGDTKRWIRSFKESRVADEIKNAGFTVKEIPEPARI